MRSSVSDIVDTALVRGLQGRDTTTAVEKYIHLTQELRSILGWEAPSGDNGP